MQLGDNWQLLSCICFNRHLSGNTVHRRFLNSRCGCFSPWRTCGSAGIKETTTALPPAGHSCQQRPADSLHLQASTSSRNPSSTSFTLTAVFKDSFQSISIQTQSPNPPSCSLGSRWITFLFHLRLHQTLNVIFPFVCVLMEGQKLSDQL